MAVSLCGLAAMWQAQGSDDVTLGRMAMHGVSGYRYCRSWVLAHGQKAKAGSVFRVPAGDIRQVAEEETAKHPAILPAWDISDGAVKVARHHPNRLVVHRDRLVSRQRRNRLGAIGTRNRENGFSQGLRRYRKCAARTAQAAGMPVLFGSDRREPWVRQRPDGGARRNRTADLLNAIQALSQLSYDPVTDPCSPLGGGEAGRNLVPRPQTIKRKVISLPHHPPCRPDRRPGGRTCCRLPLPLRPGRCRHRPRRLPRRDRHPRCRPPRRRPRPAPRRPRG